MDHETVRLFQLQVSEQVLQEKNTFLDQELYQRRRLFRCIFGFFVTIIFIIAATAVAVYFLYKTNETCEKWVQNKVVGKYAHYGHDYYISFIHHRC